MRFGFGADTAAAAKYLGLDESALRDKLRNGQSLADVAKAQNKDVQGPRGRDRRRAEGSARSGGERQEAHAEPGRQILAELKSHVADLVNAAPPDRPAFRGGAAPGRGSSSGRRPRRLDVSQAAGARYYAAMASTDIDRLSIDTIRTLSMDGVQAANSGHPGLPMAMAPVAYLLFARIMEHNPADPHVARPRPLRPVRPATARCSCTPVLHLSGYDLPLDELKNFRQWGSLTPGHPERDRVHVTPGVEITTGPLGQGFANGVGMAMAERFLRAHFGAEVQNHRVFAIVSDGDLMEGIAAEAASLAGKLGLGRIVYLYDDNDISLDGPTELSFDTEDVAKRFEAYRWHVQTVDDANDLPRSRWPSTRPCARRSVPSLIRVKSIIGWPSPNKQGTSKAHGSPLGEDEVRLTKEDLGWDPDQHFVVPDEVRAHFDQRERGAALQAEWEQRYRAWRAGQRGAGQAVGRRVGQAGRCPGCARR
jgi:transketolase